jgi:hypothetical protein
MNAGVAGCDDPNESHEVDGKGLIGGLSEFLPLNDLLPSILRDSRGALAGLIWAEASLHCNPEKKLRKGEAERLNDPDRIPVGRPSSILSLLDSTAGDLPRRSPALEFPLSSGDVSMKITGSAAPGESIFSGKEDDVEVVSVDQVD